MSENPCKIDQAYEYAAPGDRNNQVRFEWLLTDAQGGLCIQTWSRGRIAFQMELEVFRSRLANRVDHGVKVKATTSQAPDHHWVLHGTSDYKSIEEAADARGINSSRWPKREGHGAYGQGERS